MQVSEKEKLERDLEELIRARRMMDKIRKGISIAKRPTTLWIYIRTSRLIMDIDHQIGLKRGEIAREEAKNGQGRTGRTAAGENADRDDDHIHGRAEAGVLDEYERAGAAGGAAGQLGDVQPVPDVAAGKIPGDRLRAGGTAEECLRRRYKERNGLRDWQREVMEADRIGRHERLVL